jgi:hypothetical protein
MGKKRKPAAAAAEYPKAAKLAVGLCLLAAMIPMGVFGFSGPTETAAEVVPQLLVMLGGGATGFFVGRRHPVWGTAVVPACVLVVSFACGLILFSLRHARLAALRERLPDYTQITFRRDPVPGRLVIRRKIVAINLEKKDIDELHLLLPDELRADVPGEVNTVLWLRWGLEVVGQYRGGGKAYRRYCDVQVIDFAAPPRLLLEKRFRGGEPPGTGTGDSYGDWPYPSIIQFLQSTPGR